ncbi:MAG: thioredoxin family protein [Candidatus Paceibacterota bacterium]|jgi:thiol-disulfide isomerase/thioredoxin
MKKTDWKIYLYAFIITLAIFITAISLSNYIDNKKTAQIKSMGEKISLDVLSSETQFALLEGAACKNVADSEFSKEMNSIAEKLSYMEDQMSQNDPELLYLKKYYSLLEIKDYLLMEKIADKCDIKPVSLIYFYTNDCSDCRKQGYVLTYLRENYPKLRVYSFDYDLDSPAVKTLASIYKVKSDFPVIIVKGKAFTGFQEKDALEKLIPELKETATSTATTTKK